MRRYSELAKLQTFDERFEYLKLDGNVGEETFGMERYLNQVFYNTKEWKSARETVIIRDEGCDLGIPGKEIPDKKLLVHHLNPINKQMILQRDPALFDPENLICTYKPTHDAIHYGASAPKTLEPTTRKPNDTKLW